MLSTSSFHTAPTLNPTPCTSPLHPCPTPCSVRYANSFTYTPFQRQVMFSTGPRWKPSMRQHMASLSVEAFALHIVKPPPGSAAGMWGSQEVGGEAPLTPSGPPGAGGGGGGGAGGAGGKGTPAPGSRKAGQVRKQGGRNGMLSFCCHDAGLQRLHVPQ